MACLYEVARISGGPGRVVSTSEAVENVEVDEFFCFAAPEPEESNSTSLHRFIKGRCQRFKHEQRILVGSDGADTTSVVLEVGVERPEDSSALVVVAELSGESSSLVLREAVLLDQGKVGLALPEVSSMSGSIRDILNIDNRVALLWNREFLAVDVECGT